MASKDKKIIWRFSDMFNTFWSLILKIEVLFKKVNHIVVVYFIILDQKGWWVHVIPESLVSR